jgi:glycosyltransferase involved in cell wall biosynthesis
MAEVLLSLGHEVHFLHLQQPLWASDDQMRQHWNSRLHVFRGLSPASCIRRGQRKLLRLTAKTLHLNLPVDSYFDPECAHYVSNLLAHHAFDVIVVSYVFYSRLFDFLPGRVLKLIDTLDVFSDRYRLYREHGQTGEFFSTGREEEGKGLDRADAVLAIQQWDASHFRSVTRKPVSIVGHLAPPVAGGEAAYAGAHGRTILFVGGPMGINVHGVNWFIEKVLPSVRKQVPNAELWLVGGICRRISDGAAIGLRRFGFVDAVEDLYRQATVVINPQQFGTGLSIKSIDALRNGRPMVTTASGARGLEEGAGSAFLQAGTADEFAHLLIDLLRNPDRAAGLAAGAREFAHRYHQRNLESLSAVVRTESAR